MDDRQYLQLNERMDRQDNLLREILVQATKTNGRVNSLESKCKTFEDDINDLTEKSNVKKGQDNVIWKILVAAGSIAAIFIAFYLEHLKK